MKNMKKLFALVLALALCFSLALPAMAADVVNETNHAYVAYQIFSGTQDSGKSELGDVKWGSGVNHVALVTELKAVNAELYKNVPAISASSTEEELALAAEQVVAALVANGGGADYHADADQFANIVAKHVVGDGTEIAPDATTADLAAGYYVIVDVTDIPAGEDDANNPALLQVTNKGNIQIAKKYNVPIVDKDIVHDGSTKKVAEHSIGDTVHFRLTGTMANNLEDFDEYKLVFHDKMSAGLSFNSSSVVVTVDSVPVTSGYTVTTGACAAHTNCTFQVTFDDILTAPVAADGTPVIKNNSVVVVEYTAVLNENAQINTANPNEVALEFSNDPNWVPTPDSDGPTGITPWRDVNVYTTKVELTKKDGNTGNILTGAEFTITGASANVVIVSYTDFQEWTDGSGTKYWLLTDGTYTETDPATLADTSMYVDTTVVYKKVVVDSARDTQAATPVAAKAYVGDDGKLSFSGLGVGTYTITETVTPAGYNTIDPITLVIGFNENTGVFTYDWSWPGGKSFSSSASVVVFNNQGSVLPETGGVGTTMFYVAGSVLVLGAAIILVAKKRKESAE